MTTTRSTLALTALMTLAACVSPEEHRRVLGARDALKQEIASLAETQRAYARENEQLRGEVERLGKQAVDSAYLREQQAKIDDLLKRYQQGSNSAVPGVELVSTSEGMAFRVLGGVLFQPGRIEISEQGKQTLIQLIATLKQEGKRIRVDGHTDDQPITNSPWHTNLRLSVERSLAVADFLISNGLAADRVGCAGFGEYRPTAPGSTEDARQKNRRVEILMLKEQ